MIAAVAVEDKFKVLNFHAKTFEDFQESRKATYNRLGQLSGADYDTAYEMLFEGRKKMDFDVIEAQFAKMMVGALKQASPAVYEWAESVHGVGTQTIARILGEIGHPVIAHPHHSEPNPKYDDSKPSSKDNPQTILVADEPFLRTVPQLWAYCSLTPDRKKKKKMTQEEALALGKTRAKTHLWNLAVGVVKGGGPYREVYDQARVHYADAMVNGKPISKGHQHNRALRMISKTVLEDMYYVAKEELLTQVS